MTNDKSGAERAPKTMRKEPHVPYCRYLRPEAATQEFSIGPKLLAELRRRRLIKSCRLGHRTVVYDRASLEAFMRSRATTTLGEEVHHEG